MVFTYKELRIVDSLLSSFILVYLEYGAFL